MSTSIYLDANAVRHQLTRLLLDYPEMTDDARLLADSIEGQTDFHEVIKRLVRQERDANAFAQAIQLQIGDLSERKTRFEKQQHMARSLIMSLMEAASQNKLKLPEATLSIMKGRLGCTIIDESVLPDEFVKVERTPRKSDIAYALKEGRDVPGATLKNGSPHLMVRVS